MLLICGFLAIAQSATGEVIPVQNMRASKMLATVNQLLPSTQVVTADDEKGVLHVRAGKEIVEQVRTYVSAFDVKPRRVRIKVETDSPIDREQGNVEAVIANNRPFSFTDASTGVSLKLAPRVNDDGTITMFIESTYQESTVTLVVRCQPNKPTFFRMGRSGGILEETTATEKDRLEWPSIKVTASVADGAPAKKAS
ncbi:MAG: secretin N-terminal domain-containing protein [Fimbriimonas sp.]